VIRGYQARVTPVSHLSRFKHPTERFVKLFSKPVLMNVGQVTL
jgi:hypothetical protein